MARRLNYSRTAYPYNHHQAAGGGSGLPKTETIPPITPEQLREARAQPDVAPTRGAPYDGQAVDALVYAVLQAMGIKRPMTL